VFSASSWPRKACGASALSLAAIVAALSVAMAPSAGAAGAVASSPPACTTAGIDVWFEPDIGGGAAGSVFYRFQLTNFSGHRCTLRGYPKAYAANLAGQRFGSAAAHEAVGGVHTVSLAAGESASAVVRVIEAGDFSPSDCHPRMAAGFRVSPPGQSGSRFVPFPFEACAKPGHTNLTIRPVKGE
jgi:Domain of unknown function (DUF4232)